MKQRIGVVTGVDIKVFDKDGKLVTHKIKKGDEEKILLEREEK